MATYGLYATDVTGSVSLSRLSGFGSGASAGKGFIYAIATSVSANVETTILTHTATATENVVRLSMTGMENAKYRIYIDTVLAETLRSGPSRNVEMNFIHPLALGTGQVLDIKVEHFVTGETPDFEATIWGFV
jgi:hypothetical protein